MKTLQRYNFNQTDYFITAVTYNREPILVLDIDLFWMSWNDTKLKAWVILDDHFHIILYSGDTSIANIMHRFKIKYSRYFRMKFRPGKVWQNRFWDYMIRNQQDLKKHLDYIHYNLVKHGHVLDPKKYAYSSFMKYYEQGIYGGDWGMIEQPIFDSEFGE